MNCNAACRATSQDDLLCILQIVLGVDPVKVRAGYGCASEVKLGVFVFDGVRSVALMQCAITVTENKLGPICKFIRGVD